MITPHAVGILDARGNIISDSVGHSLVATDIEHYLEHVGRAWVLSDTTTVTAGSNLDILIKNGASGEVHLKAYHYTSTQANAVVVLYGSTTVSADGTLQTLRNKNLAYQGSTPQATCYIGPTITTVGDQLEHSLLVGSKQSGGSIERYEDEWIIPASTNMLIRYTNNSASTDSIDYWLKLLDVAGL